MSPLTTNNDREEGSAPSAAARKRAPLTQARAHATRERILNQALRAFARIGYDSASLTSDILQPAGVSVGSFYHQFDSKRHVFEDLIQGVISERREAAISRIDADGPANLNEAIAQVLTTMYDDVDTNPDVWRVLYRGDELNDDDLRALVVSNLKAWNDVVAGQLKRQVGSNDKNIVAATDINMALIHGLVRSYLMSNDAARAKLRGHAFGLSVDFAVGGVNAVLNS